MRRSIKFLLVLLLFSSAAAFGQEKSETAKSGSDKAISITFHPLFLFNNAIKLDAELQTNKLFAFIAGAEFYGGRITDLYSLKNNFGDPIADKISGVGINLAVKYKVDQSTEVNSYYFSPGITYRRLSLELNGPAYYSYIEDGVEYHSYGTVKQKENVNPLLIYGNFGRYYELNSIVADVYVGIGYKVLGQNEALLETRKYHKTMFGYNFKGAIFQLGVKLGWQISK